MENDAQHPSSKNRLLTAPQKNNGGKWRLAYYQGGNYYDYIANLRAIVHALVELGWIEQIDIPDFRDSIDAETVWHYISSKVESDALEFAADGYWSAAWDEKLRSVVRKVAIQGLAGNDFDLVIAMGTWAGQDLVNDQHQVPTLALSSNAPIEAGIIKSFAESGYEHVLVEVDPERYRRQIRLYHDIIGFKRLGVVYEDSQDGRLYANLADLEHIAQERGFSLVHCHAVDIPSDEMASLQAVKRCYDEIASKIDALWIGSHIGEQTKFMPSSLEKIFEHKIPTITFQGPLAVERGVLLSIAYSDFETAGQWYVENMAEILKGSKPGALNQVFEMPGHTVINLETARRIGFKVPGWLMSSAEMKYETILES